MNENEKDLLLLWLLQKYKTRKSPRRFWVRPIYLERRRLGHYHNLVQEMRLHDEESHFNYFRMSKAQMDKLLHYVGPHIEPGGTNFRKDELRAAERLSLTVRFLASGDSYASMGFAYRCAPSTVCNVIQSTTRALWEVLSPIYMSTPTQESWSAISDGFQEKWNFPHCCGALDGKHVIIKCPPNTGSMFFNYKKTFSVVLLAVADSKYRFVMVDVGGQGRQSDGGTFSESEFGQSLEDGTINFPSECELPGSTLSFPYVLVADEAFPLLATIMRPYPGAGLPKTKLIYNYRLKRARMVIENAFGILCARWRIYHKVIEMLPENVDYLILCTCVLHNFLRTEGLSMGNNDRYCPVGYTDGVSDDGNTLQNGQWRSEIPHQYTKKFGRIGTNNYKKEAGLLRDNLAKYFISPAGQVDFQDRAILKYASFKKFKPA